VRWRRFTISIRSSSSRRTVPIHRSAIAFAWGARTGVQDLNTLVGEHGIKNTGERAVAVPNQEPELGCAVAEVHQKVARMLCNPAAAGVGGDAEEVDPTGRVFDDE
jgi:hypothetical protein